VTTLLVSSGEPSGDRLVSRVLSASGWTAFGMGGAPVAAAGAELVVRSESLAVMGLADVAGAGMRLLSAWQVLTSEAERRRPEVALLAGFTEFNQRLGAWLRSRGTRVVWCGAPQVWAWRRSRLRSMRESADAIGVLLPFEEELWRSHGYDARYVGHPSLESCGWREPRAPGRLAVLCGSRPGEVERLSAPLLEAARLFVQRHAGWEAVAVVSPSLPARLRERIESDACGIPIELGDEVEGAAPRLAEFDLALAASGTVCLEAALSGTPPVIAYRFDPVTAALGRMLIKTEHIGLPNVVLGRRAFPELLQGDVNPESIAAAADGVVDGLGNAARDCRAVRDAMMREDRKSYGERVTELLRG